MNPDNIKFRLDTFKLPSDFGPLSVRNGDREKRLTNAGPVCAAWQQSRVYLRPHAKVFGHCSTILLKLVYANGNAKCVHK